MYGVHSYQDAKRVYVSSGVSEIEIHLCLPLSLPSFQGNEASKQNLEALCNKKQRTLMIFRPFPWTPHSNHVKRRPRSWAIFRECFEYSLSAPTSSEEHTQLFSGTNTVAALTVRASFHSRPAFFPSQPDNQTDSQTARQPDSQSPSHRGRLCQFLTRSNDARPEIEYATFEFKNDRKVLSRHPVESLKDWFTLRNNIPWHRVPLRPSLLLCTSRELCKGPA
jgi:hypothetical protein